MSESQRLVSIVVPCRNERAHIGAFLVGALRQALPPGWALQVVVADGLSDDGTRELLRDAAENDERLLYVDNPQRFVATGLNRALAVAGGEVIVRMDVHTEYESDYVAACLEALAASGADNVGGAWRAEASSDAPAMGQAIAAAFQSRWVAGGALSRRLDYDGPADTVYLGAWPRRTFERFGTFDESLVRNQDDEHNLRIVRGGGRVWQSSRIRSTYSPRASLGQVFRQYLQYGYWKPFVMKKHGQPAKVRHLVPMVFVVALASAAVVAFAGLGTWPFAALLAAYGLAVAALGASVVREARLGLTPALCVPAVIATYHLAYGCGSLVGWLDVVRGRPGRARFATLTR